MPLFSQVIIVLFMIVLGILIFRTTKFELKTQSLTIAALLIVIAIILGTRYFIISIPLLGPESFEIKFDTIPIMFAGILFGPGWGFIAGLTTDLLQLMVSGVAFPFFGFTLNLVLTGVFAGLIFSKRNTLSDRLMILLTQGFIAIITVMAIMYIGVNHEILLSGTTFQLTGPIKITVGLVLFSLALLLIIYLHRLLTGIEDLKEKHFMARFAMLVVLCEVIIQMILTSLWLSIMFELPWLVYMAPRIVEAVIMIFGFILVGQLLYRLIFKRFIHHQFN